QNGLFWPVLGCFWAVFACCGDRGERSETSAISAPWNPPGGTGLDGAFDNRDGAARFARCPPLAACSSQNGLFWPVFGCFWAVFAARGDRW
ncbi:unnamed protein product, partial [Musa textilis]